MTKLGKFLKKMQSIKKTSFNHHNQHQSLSRRSSSSSSSSNVNSNSNFSYDSSSPESFSGNNLCPVYVGKSRRRYMVSSEVIDHPLFRELVERSIGGGYGGDEEVFVECEVVLFEHMLWMLENADPQPESLDELVDFYAC
ncbi:auxin-responsive protein SAUR76-like [Amaranthus tricolor]|uniref:auxin-responsive protein SAUR76-like n=1 Tax=Amaranthus tricolor TaxID=29722 RepID=UPI0025891A24|nr:auxin-responsive protein SAUR76-like [Amaranthus tricolor]